MERQINPKKKFPVWAIALIVLAGLGLIIVMAPYGCMAAIMVADEIEHPHAGDSNYWIVKSQTLLANDRELLEGINKDMREAGVYEISYVEPTENVSQIYNYDPDKYIEVNNSKYFISFDEGKVPAKDKTNALANMMDTLTKKYGLQRVSNYVYMDITEYGFMKASGILSFSIFSDSLIRIRGNEEIENFRPGRTIKTEQIEDGWYYIYYSVD